MAHCFSTDPGEAVRREEIRRKKSRKLIWRVHCWDVWFTNLSAWRLHPNTRNQAKGMLEVLRLAVCSEFDSRVSVRPSYLSVIYLLFLSSSMPLRKSCFYQIVKRAGNRIINRFWIMVFLSSLSFSIFIFLFGDIICIL